MGLNKPAMIYPVRKRLDFRFQKFELIVDSLKRRGNISEVTLGIFRCRDEKTDIIFMKYRKFNTSLKRNLLVFRLSFFISGKFAIFFFTNACLLVNTAGTPAASALFA